MKQTRLQRWKKSWFGRVLRRVVGEEKGAVMMEYVLVAVLIAGACVVAVALFGKQIVTMFNAAGQAASADAAAAKKTVGDARKDAGTNATTASKHQEAMSKLGN